MSDNLIRALTLVTLLTAGSAQAYVIDGKLNDWGIQRNSQASGLTPNVATTKAYKVEDQHGSNYLNPGWGNQAYDAEGMYVSWDTSNLYVAMITGHTPLTPNNFSGNSYGAGDLAIDFGINGVFEYGVELTGSTTTTQGHVYSSIDWAVGLFKTDGTYTGYTNPNLAANRAVADATHPTSILTAGVDRGMASVAYTTAGQTKYGAWKDDTHFFYEVSIPLSSFGPDWSNGSNFRVHWSQNCANDSIWVDAVATKQVPEPGTLALLPLGMLGLASLRRTKRAKKSA